jgi:hypothetical protein
LISKPPILPVLRYFDREAAIIGRLLISYTEIEFQLCLCVGMAGRDVAAAITELFSKRGETNRVRRADRLGRAQYADVGLGHEFDAAIDDMFLCVAIRNQYAHCIWWHDNQIGQLAFAHMEEAAQPGGSDPDIRNLTFHHVDEDLLREQECFFFAAQDGFRYLNYKRRQLVGDIGKDAILAPRFIAARPQMHLEDGL